MKMTIRSRLLRTVGCLCLCVLMTACGTFRRTKGEWKPKPFEETFSKKLSPEGVPAVPELSDEEQRKFDYFFLEAHRLKIKEDYAGAFELLRHALHIHPGSPSALYEMAQYHLYLKQLPEARVALKKAVELQPDNYWYAQALSTLYLQQNELGEAIVLLEAMSRRFPLRPEPLYSLLEIYGKQERYDQLITTLDRLERRMGKSEQLSMEKFRIYLRMQNITKAFREIETLVEEYPADLRYRVVLGDVYLQNGKEEDAYKLYREVLDAEPDHAMAIYSLASYYDKTGQQALYRAQLDTLLLNRKVPVETKLTVMRQVIGEAERSERDSSRVTMLFDRILEQESDDSRLSMLYAQYLISKGKEKASLPVFRQVLNIEPANTAARMTLLGEAVRNADYEEVIRLCEVGTEVNPEMLEFYFYLAIGYNQAERPDDALAVCLKALTYVTAESKKEVVSDFYAIMGDIYHAKKQNSEAYAAYESALSYYPSNIGVLNNYAYYLSLGRENLDKAEEMSYRTVKAEPNNATFLDTYAWILFEKGKYVEARIYIDEAMKNKGNESVVIVEHCGDIYYMNGNVEEALGYWQRANEMGGGSKNLKRKIEMKKYIPE